MRFGAFVFLDFGFFGADDHAFTNTLNHLKQVCSPRRTL